MVSTLPPETGGNFELAPEGNHVAVCYRVIDIGTQEQKWQSEIKHYPKIIVYWELPHERMKDGRPFSVQQQYTWSMSDKATLRHHLEAWRGKAFQEADFGPKGFNIKNILGKGCMLQIVHREGTNGKTYANIATIAALPKGTVAPAPENGTVFFDLDNMDEAIFRDFPEWLRKKIEASPEFQLATGQPVDDGRPPLDESNFDDEVPF